MAENNLSELGGSVQLTVESGGQLAISIARELLRMPSTMFDIKSWGPGPTLESYLVVRIPLNMLSDGSKSAMLQGLLFNPKRPRKRKREPRIFLPGGRFAIWVPLEAIKPPFPIFTYENDNLVVRLAVKKLSDVSKFAIQDSLMCNVGSVVEPAASVEATSVEAAASNLLSFHIPAVTSSVFRMEQIEEGNV